MSAAACLALLGAGCAGWQRCQITPWFELERRSRVDLLPGVASYGETAVSARVLVGGRWIETERVRALSLDVTPDAVLLILGGPGAAREGHVYRPGDPIFGWLDLRECPRPLVLADRRSLLCWSCDPAGAEPAAACRGQEARFSELGLDGKTRWERQIPLPSTPEGKRCPIEEVYGLTAEGNPLARVACPAPPSSGPRADPFIRVDVELRADGPVEVPLTAVPQVQAAAPWAGGQCPAPARL